MRKKRKIQLCVGLTSTLLLVFYSQELKLLLLRSVMVTGPKDSRLWAVEKLSEEGEAGLSGMVIGLEDPSDVVRISASHEINSLGEDANRAIPSLLLALEDERESIRLTTLKTVRKIGEAIPPGDRTKVVEALARSAIFDASGLVNLEAAHCLRDLAKNTDWPELDLAKSILNNAAENSDLYVRESAFIAARLMGSRFTPEIRVLLESTNDRSVTVRECAVRCLGAQNFDSKLAIPALEEKLSDEDSDVRFSAARSLSEYGAAAQNSVPLILRATILETQDHQHLAPLLRKIGLEFVIAELSKLENCHDKEAREAAKKLLRHLKH